MDGASLEAAINNYKGVSSEIREALEYASNMATGIDTPEEVWDLVSELLATFGETELRSRVLRGASSRVGSVFIPGMDIDGPTPWQDVIIQQDSVLRVAPNLTNTISATKTKILNELKRNVWERLHPGTPFPGDGNGSDEDDEVEMVGVIEQGGGVVCPLTKDEFEDPVKHTGCKHVYSRVALMEYISSVRIGGSAQCPVSGCSKVIDVSSIESDFAMKTKLRRMAQTQATRGSRWRRNRQNAISDSDSDIELNSESE